ncbi:hypothetical protein Pres01_40970 [Metapseudomonas resinovorans]|nr:hypothetical protein Pres01_40970 [Pseudomonas resinovorans]
MAPDGIGTIAIKTMSSDESWTITGLNIQSLMGKGAMEDVVDEILLEVFSLNDGPPMHSLNIAKKA